MNFFGTSKVETGGAPAQMELTPAQQETQTQIDALQAQIVQMERERAIASAAGQVEDTTLEERQKISQEIIRLKGVLAGQGRSAA